MIGYTSFVFFILYFGATYLLYTIAPTKAKWCVLLLGSYVFYFVSAKGHIIPLIIANVIIWVIGLALQKLNDTMKLKRKQAPKEERKQIKAKFTKYKQWVLSLGVISTIGILLVCKYSNFFIDTTNSIFGSSLNNVKIIQPLGISFYTLQAVSYLVDIHHGKIEAEKNPFRVSLFLSFMLTIVEGPVARYDQLGKQLNGGKIFDPHSLVYGVVRAVWGLFKKIVVADRLAMFANAVFDNSADYAGAMVVLGILSYTFQLYLEFSGVMDIMCGLSQMMGIELPENFNHPFFAKTINEFWQRWHISLGSWLRDYIFYPISLSKPFMSIAKSARKKFNAYYANLIPTAFALFFVWFGNGFWHGSGWKYVCYGLYYYVLMMIALFLEPMFKAVCEKLKINRSSKAYSYFQIVRTFVVVNFGMLIFRAEDLKTAFYMFTSMFRRGEFSSLVNGADGEIGLDIKDYVIIFIGLAIVFAVSLLHEKGIDIREKISKLPYLAKFVIFMLTIFVVVIFGAYGEGYGVADLIYANF